MNDEEDRAHFSLWAIMASPLIAGNDLRSMSETTLVDWRRSGRRAGVGSAGSAGEACFT
ncbi:MULTISPECIES: hypothetical protein [unclassified Microbulbifer]|uniref:hypothetical protein n=1 Tax=unclassified Microbulbifer TaxID=2619833 RepID=UPI0027E53AFC|nr:MULTISPECIES: hypothetical protein [unclassified Microbulbifer]